MCANMQDDSVTIQANGHSQNGAIEWGTCSYHGDTNNIELLVLSQSSVYVKHTYIEVDYTN